MNYPRRSWTRVAGIEFQCVTHQTTLNCSDTFKNVVSRLPLLRGSLVWWRKLMNWACCATARSLSSSSTPTINCFSMPLLTWTRFCSSIQVMAIVTSWALLTHDLCKSMLYWDLQWYCYSAWRCRTFLHYFGESKIRSMDEDWSPEAKISHLQLVALTVLHHVALGYDNWLRTERRGFNLRSERNLWLLVLP